MNDQVIGRRFLNDATPPWMKERPSCRWCREPVIRGLPCTCQRAQQEFASIRAGTDR